VLVSLVLYNSLLLGVLAWLLQRPVGKEWYNPMLLQIHLPSAFGTWSGTPNSSQHSPSAIWSARASWLECLPGIASILQHLSCGLSDSSVSGDVSSPCVMELAVTPHGSYAGVCCQECVAKASELDTRASWDWEDSDLCSNCVSSGKAGPGSGNHWNPCSWLFHWDISASLDCLDNLILQLL